MSAKQLAMAWINEMLSTERINPLESDFSELFGLTVSEKKAQEVINFIKEDLAKVKVRYQSYVEKYSPELLKDKNNEKVE